MLKIEYREWFYECIINKESVFHIFLKKYIYLFIWLHQVLLAAGGLLSCGSRAP